MSPFSSEGMMVRFYWGPRREAASRCARRLSTFLKRLAAIDPVFSEWRNAWSRGRARHHQVPISLLQLEEWLAAGAHRADVGRKVMNQLGYSIWLSAAAKYGDASPDLSLDCGGHDGSSNECLMRLPEKGSLSDRLLNVPVLLDLCKAMIAAWEPDEGVVTTHECGDLLLPKNFDPCDGYPPEAGWITYLPARLRDLNAPSSADVEEVDGGRLVITTGERFSTMNSRHMKIVKELTATLRAQVR